jgi:hypothetical protein
MSGEWLQFVKFFHEKNSHLSYKQAKKQAVEPYHNLKAYFEQKGGSGIIKEQKEDNDDVEQYVQQRIQASSKGFNANMRHEESDYEAKQLAKQTEKQELDDFYRELYARDPNLTLDAYKNDTINYKRSLPFFKHISSLGEKILFIQRVTTPQGGQDFGLFLTNQNVYVLNYNINNEKYECYVLSVYTFDKPLNLKQAKMLYNHLNKTLPVGIKTNFNQVIGTGGGQMFRIYNEWISRQFEEVIRVIPGSFQNDDWRQLDGFFGVYYNEKTMEINIFPGKLF